jgi:MFS family permease
MDGLKINKMHKNIKLLGLFNFFTDFNLYSAVLVIYFSHITGSFTLAMSLFAITMVSSAVFEIPTGIFSDFVGRRNTVILGAISSVASVIFYAIGVNYWFLLIGAILQGLQRAWYSGNNDALLHDTLSSIGRRDEYDSFLGKTSSMFQLAATVGVAIGAILATWSFSLIMWLSVIPQLACLYLSLQLSEVSKSDLTQGNIYSHIYSSMKNIWNNKTLRLLTINNVIGFAVGESTYQFRAAFVNTLWPLWAIGISKVLTNIGATLSFWFSGKINKKIGDFKILFIGSVYSKIVNIFSVSIPSVWSPLVMSTTSLFFGTSTVAESKLMQKEFSDEQRATTASLSSLLGNITFGMFALILGFLADIFGPGKALLIAYIISLPTIGINWYLHKLNKV